MNDVLCLLSHRRLRPPAMFDIYVFDNQDVEAVVVDEFQQPAPRSCREIRFFNRRDLAEEIL